MKFALFNGLGGISWRTLTDLWRHVEETGWDVSFVTDHFMPSEGDMTHEVLECWASLAGLSQVTGRMRIGTLVSGNTYRHPAVLAKMAANVDIMSGGRLIFGIGAGWQENEHEAYGIHYGTVGERMDRLDEACQVILALWQKGIADFRGTYYQLKEAPLYPKPLQSPYPEFLIGGGGIKRTLRIAAKYADHWNDWGGPANFEYKNPILEEHCEAVGRDPGEITRSANMPMMISEDESEVEQLRREFAHGFVLSEDEARDYVLGGTVDQVMEILGRLREAKVDMLCIPTFYPRWSYEQLDQFIEEVAPAFR